MPREHGDDGTYVETVPLGRVLEVFDAVDGPVILSADVADELGCSRETARRKLQQLHDRGDLARRKVSRRVIYWRADESDTFGGEGLRGDPETTLADKSGEDGARANVGDDATDTPPDPPADAHGAERAAEGDALADAVDAVAEDVLPGSGAKLEARREALHAAVEYLREHGAATPSDFQTDVYPDHPGRYTAGDDPAYSWWTNCIYKGLRELAERTDLVEKADTTGEWSWRGGSV